MTQSRSKNKKKPQKPYHHGHLKDALMEAAIASLRKGGATNLSMRALAREAGVSQTAPFRHFKDKTGLLDTLAVEGFLLLEAELLKACDDCEDDFFYALKTTGKGYVNFGLKNPEVYELMFGPYIKNEDKSEALCEVGDRTFGILLNIIKGGIEAGLFRCGDHELLTIAAWANVHGLTSLILGRLGDKLTDEQKLGQIEVSTTLIARGLLKGS